MRSDVLGDIMLTLFYVVPLKIFLAGVAVVILMLWLRPPALVRMKRLYGLWRTRQGKGEAGSWTGVEREAALVPAGGEIVMDIGIVGVFLVAAVLAVPWLVFSGLLLYRMLVIGY